MRAWALVMFRVQGLAFRVNWGLGFRVFFGDDA